MKMKLDSEAGNTMIHDTNTQIQNYEMNSLKALIECLIGANVSVSWVCLHFGPCNQWKWRWMTTSLFVSEWAWGKTDSGKVVFFATDFWPFKVRRFGILRLQCLWTLFAGSTVRENRLGLRQNSLLIWTNQPDWRKAMSYYLLLVQYCQWMESH